VSILLLYMEQELTHSKTRAHKRCLPSPDDTKYSQLVRLQPESIRRVVSVLLPEAADGVVDGAADFVADLAQLLAEGERAFVPLPVVVPLPPAVAGVVPVARWRYNGTSVS